MERFRSTRASVATENTARKYSNQRDRLRRSTIEAGRSKRELTLRDRRTRSSHREASATRRSTFRTTRAGGLRPFANSACNHPSGGEASKRVVETAEGVGGARTLSDGKNSHVEWPATDVARAAAFSRGVARLVTRLASNSARPYSLGSALSRAEQHPTRSARDRLDPSTAMVHVGCRRNGRRASRVPLGGLVLDRRRVQHGRPEVQDPQRAAVTLTTSDRSRDTLGTQNPGR
jgi:hypothetical protein